MNTGDHASRIRSAVESNAAARSAIVASWRRCTHAYGLDPELSGPQRLLDGAEFRDIFQRTEPLLAIARPGMERLNALAGGSGYCVMLAGTDGVPVEWLGPAGDLDDAKSLGLRIGVDWSERSEGTNGIGTCLVEKRALTIHREQHFYSRDLEISCAVAPVFDHRGQIAGALDISIYRSDVPEGFTGLMAMAVMETARQIEAEMFRQAFPGARILSVPGRDIAHPGFLAVDRDDIVIGATRAARIALSIADEDIGRGLPVEDMLGGESDSRQDMNDAWRGVLRRTLARTNGNVTAAATALDLSRATLKRKLKLFGIRRKQ